MKNTETSFVFLARLLVSLPTKKAKSMLSILIPTYNYDCMQLVDDLQAQALQAGIEHEIIVADDASPDTIYKVANRAINDNPYCRLIELETNVGRARIRNLLAQEEAASS